MAYNPDLHHRRSIRKAGFDYTQPGAYFVTICTQDRQCVLADPIVAGIIQAAWLALPRWFPTIGLDELAIMPNHTHSVIWLTVNPEHEGGAKPATALALSPTSGAQIQIYGQPQGDIGRPQGDIGRPQGDIGRPQGDAPTGDWVIPQPESTNEHPRLGDVVGAWKSLVTNVYLDWIKRHDPARRAKFWQRNYYERIIHNDSMLLAIRQYIRDNPKNWPDDPDNLANRLGLAYPESIEDYLNGIRNHP